MSDIIDTLALSLPEITDLMYDDAAITKPSVIRPTIYTETVTGISSPNCDMYAVYTQSFYTDSGWTFYIDRYSSAFTLKSNCYACLVRIPINKFYYRLTSPYTSVDTGNEIYIYLLLSNNTQPLEFSDKQWVSSRNGSGNISEDDYTSHLATTLESVSQVNSQCASQYGVYPDKLNTLISYLANHGNFYSNALTGYYEYPIPFKYRDGYAMNGSFTWHSFGLPLFDVDSVTNIYNYLTTGDESGKIDPFEPPVVEDIEVTDYTTNYVLYMYKKNDTYNKCCLTAYNADYNENRAVLSGNYQLIAQYQQQSESGNMHYITDNSQALSVEFYAAQPRENYNLLIYAQFQNLNDETKYSPQTLIEFTYNEGAATASKALLVTMGGRSCSKATTDDGYIFTDDNGASATGATVTIHLTGYSQEDIDNISDPDYWNGESEEDESTGTDSDYLVGNGFNTFNITTAQFNTINSALWSTDWTQVFKSSTINPINCVIGCKAIPFTATNSDLKEVIIANLDTGVETNTVKAVKSFDVATVTINPINGDFTDMKYVKVRCFLPFIGWVELPAEEVISRAQYTAFGILKTDKELKFKYIVDFIDGNCRCIISVNGTERWYYDGNCSIDVPLTSDDHTNAVSASIKAGFSTVLSVGAVIGGALTENAAAATSGAIGAIKSAPNIVPTYSYSMSHSPSGYIEASMNKHIMIILELPSIQLPNGYAKKYGRPCERNLSLSGLNGFTKTRNADASGINATAEEQSRIQSMLDAGVYL